MMNTSNSVLITSICLVSFYYYFILTQYICVSLDYMEKQLKHFHSFNDISTMAGEIQVIVVRRSNLIAGLCVSRYNV